jgi:hypothetical protein
MEIGVGKLVVILLVVALKFVFVVAPILAIAWFVTRTQTGRRIFGLKDRSGDESPSIAVVDQIRSLQSQVDEAHSRLDFAERVMVEQREQLRALGAPEPRAELRELTPV